MATTAKRKCGRPLANEGEQRLLHIVKTALRLFLDNGYGTTSLESIAAGAGVAKTTIYRHFGDKKGLFETCMDAATRDFRIQLAEMPFHPYSVEEGLRYAALCFLEILYKSESISLMRLLFAEAPRFPELGKIYRTQAKSILLTSIEAFLERNITAGTLRADAAVTGADQFQHLVMSSRYFDVLLGTAEIPSATEKSEIAEEAIRTFLARYAPPRG